MNEFNEFSAEAGEALSSCERMALSGWFYTFMLIFAWWLWSNWTAEAVGEAKAHGAPVYFAIGAKSNLQQEESEDIRKYSEEGNG